MKKVIDFLKKVFDILAAGITFVTIVFWCSEAVKVVIPIFLLGAI